jgi:hypothetical protein
MARSAIHTGRQYFMVKPAYLLAAFVTMLVFLAGLGAFVFGPDSGPFSNGASPSLVHK